MCSGNPPLPPVTLFLRSPSYSKSWIRQCARKGVCRCVARILPRGGARPEGPALHWARGPFGGALGAFRGVRGPFGGVRGAFRGARGPSREAPMVKGHGPLATPLGV